MCYAIPGKITDIQGKIAFITYFNETKKAVMEQTNIMVGDYVYAQGGYVIEKIPVAEAESMLEAWQDLFFEFKEVDNQFSNPETKLKSSNPELNELFRNVTEKNQLLSIADAEKIMQLKNKQDLTLLYQTANSLRHQNLGNACCVHGILEISNFCQRNCLYCGINQQNISLRRYKLTKDQVLKLAVQAVEQYHFKSLVLQAGEGSYTVAELAEIIKTIKSHLNVLIFISFGEIGLPGLKTLFEAGARGLLLRFETSNPNLYQKLHPGFNLETRLSHLRYAYELGYLIITGGLIGLPGQTEKDLVQDILLTKGLNAEMFSFGPFLPHPVTSLAKHALPDADLVLKVLALSRLLAPPEAKILVTTAFETLKQNARQKGLLAGANSLMLNITPIRLRKLYEIYPKRKHNVTSIQKQIDQTLVLLKSLGRAPIDLGI